MVLSVAMPCNGLYVGRKTVILDSLVARKYDGLF